MSPVSDTYPMIKLSVYLSKAKSDNYLEKRRYEAFSPAEARRILKKIEFHYTPKHASWLNMVEIEIGTMNKQCLKRRIHSFELLEEELRAWEKSRNNAKSTINWLFNVDLAREKLEKAYGALN
ncbi:transposase [Shewanella inventionis]|uniref:Tc1-like transposase DDE domain-containing protein n=1 Tax=Shewanella inventionis TaxID=1738770 RepID=A0ABQ1JAB3_9GAMM|nr:transposase [Shewanella inventionis]MCL1157853.1 transposase [Shewanella inventionis]GGB63690.1 hypothetical protein GCM10011607_25550 [Shewanella inventionis]